jgi:hypothetical protein
LSLLRLAGKVESARNLYSTEKGMKYLSHDSFLSVYSDY